jgi:hypothetical protein
MLKAKARLVHFVSKECIEDRSRWESTKRTSKMQRLAQSCVEC